MIHTWERESGSLVKREEDFRERLHRRDLNFVKWSHLLCRQEGVGFQMWAKV